MYRFCLAVVLLLLTAAAPSSRRAEIPAGLFTPLYGVQDATQQKPVASFLVDVYPVTNAEFSAFISSKPEWGRGAVSGMLADKNYLKHWDSANGPRKEQLRQPVVNVSWFAAQAFCRARGGRLASVLEWEYIAAASETDRDSSRDPAFVQRLLQWYAKPGGSDIEAIGQGKANYYGVHDLHGLIWEWNADFNSVLVGGDSRREAEELKNMFCGAGAMAGVDKANYAAYMRYALRNSLKGNYTTENLGFRCAYDR